jgi:hypothetical protein
MHSTFETTFLSFHSPMLLSIRHELAMVDWGGAVIGRLSFWELEGDLSVYVYNLIIFYD